MDNCPLCVGELRKPKILPCMDTVCFSCLDEYVLQQARPSGTFPCPVCNLELPLPDGGIAQFDDNQHVKGDQTLDDALLDAQVPCEVCEDRENAVQRCIDCEQNFCTKCSKTHLKMNVAKTHTLINVSDPQGKRYLTSIGYCDKHKNEELTFYCRTCQIPVCMRCRLTVHEDHTTEDLVDCASRTRRDLKLALDENNGFRFHMLNEIEELRVYGEKTKENEERVRRAIGERRQQFHKAVDSICDTMLERLEQETRFEQNRIAEDTDLVETDMLNLSKKIATANQIVEFGSDIKVVRNRADILGSLALARKDVPLSITGIKLNVDFSCQRQAEGSLKYLVGRLSTDIVPPKYISVTEVSAFRVENTSDVINSICPSPDDNCWVACGWKSDISLFDRYGKKIRSKSVGRDVDCMAIDSDGNSYVSCRDEHAVKRFDRNFRRRMATLNIEYPRGIATTTDNKLIICVNKSTTYFDYDPNHENRVLKLGPNGDESKELKNPQLCFMYPIRVTVNTNNELCVSDNLQHAVLFLRPSGQLKTSYLGATKTDHIDRVPAAPQKSRLRTANTSTARTGAVSFKLPDSRKEQDGPLEHDSFSAIQNGQAHTGSLTTFDRTPMNSPKTVHASEKALVPINISYEDTFDSSVSLSSSLEPASIEKSVPAYVKALSGMSGALDSASVTDVQSEAEYPAYMPPFDPRGIACDKYGHVIVCDYSSNIVHLLDKHGRFLMYLLTEADGIFGPTSVAVDKSGYLWVGGGDATVKIYRYINFEDTVG